MGNGAVCALGITYQFLLLQMLGTKEFKNFYIWYNAVCVDSLIGQIEVGESLKHGQSKYWKR